MKTYIKDIEVSRIYGVGVATVNTWKNKAKEGFNNLEWVEVEGKIRIVDNENNRLELTKLAEEGKKHRNKTVCKKVDLQTSLNSIFSTEEISEIYNDLLFQKQIKFKFSYLDGGAKSWDEYYLSGVSQHVKINEDFLQSSYSELIMNLPQGAKLNIFDLGPGNAYPVKNLIEFLLKKGFNLTNYYCVDISQEINEIALSNIQQWFPKLKTKSFKSDLENTKFDSIFLENTSADEINLILYLGHTFPNHEDRYSVLKNLRSGMGQHDIFCFSYTNQNPKNKGSFKYVTNENADFRHTLVASKLGIDIDKCQKLMQYDDQKHARFKYLILDKDYDITFNIYGHSKTVRLAKQDKICIWQHYLIDNIDLIQELDATRFGLLGLKQDQTFCHGFVIARGV
jgi:uncharacterized SAM-dependent methyltransferase